MKIAIVGAGYVGLVSGACLAEFGFDVACIDNDADRVRELAQGRVPIHEPGLDDLVRSGRSSGRLRFTAELDPAVVASDVVMIAVGTPSRRGEDAADLAFVHRAAEEIAAALNGYKVIVTKSTVPVGTTRTLMHEIARRRPGLAFDMASNPEFLREGSAVADFLSPDRIVVGTESERARDILRQLYRPITSTGVPINFTGIESAELIKYAANGYLAMRIAFVNELADLCEKVGADISVVTRGMGQDRRIGQHYLQPGPGFGGSCFPKDSRALAAEARDRQVPFRIIEAVVAANDGRKAALGDRIVAAMGGDVSGRRIAVLGIAFKADTDDIRDSAALQLIPELKALGASLAVYDPVAGANGAARIAGVVWCKNAYAAAAGADAVVILTEWNEFRGLDLEKLAGLMARPLMIDLRNLYSLQDIAKTPFVYHSLGRPVVRPPGPAGAA
jgi:UDPglucose 6-dehydrogenase